MNKLKQIYNSMPIIREINRAAGLTDAARAELAQLRKLRAAEISERLRTEKTAREGAKSLHAAERQVCSQNGEDGVLEEIFRRIGPGRRTFAEIGIGDGIENNTAFLYSQGWTGHWIDSQPPPAALSDEEARTLKFRQSFVTRETIAALFTELGVPAELDLLSIDIDQNTHAIWQALHAWRARVVVVEYNATLPPSVDWEAVYGAERVWDGSANYGASLKAFERLGRSFGYELVHCEIIGSNAFFVRRELVGDRFLGSFDAETHYEPSRLELIHRSGHRASRLDRRADA